MESEGKIYLTSGGYVDEQRSEKLDGILEYYATACNVVVVDNATTTGSNKNGILSVVNNFGKIAKKVEIITLNEQNIHDLNKFDVVYITSGDVSLLIEIAKSKIIKYGLYNYVKNGGVIFTEGVASTVFGKDIKWYYDVKQGTKPRYSVNLETYKGFGFSSINFYPHWNRISADIKEKSLSYAKDQGIWLNVVSDGEFIELKISDIKYAPEIHEE